ncbi:MAG TPA: PAS domain S-box protein, partial [Pyrinomonadaceae bacterium]|nr:PAS domain S-box protein [Pyrinomonadaceae bacterium]
AEGNIGIRNIIEGPDGSVWVASDNGLLRRTRDGRWVFYTIPKYYDFGNEAGGLMADKDGNIWVTVRTGLFIYNPESAETLATLPDQHRLSPPITNVELGASGSFELPKPGTMTRLIGSSLSSPLAGSAIVGSAEAVHQTLDGRIWFSTKDSLYSIEGQKYRRMDDSSLRPGVSKGIVEDSEGNLWIGTANGVSKLVIDGLTSYDQASGLIDPNVYSIQEMPDGRMIVSHGTWHMSWLSGSRFETAQLNLGPKARFGWTGLPLYADSKGAIWALETFGLYEFEPRPTLTAQAKQEPIKRESLATYRAFTDKAGGMWIAGNAGSTKNQLPLHRYDPATGEWRDYSGYEGFPVGRPIASFAEDNSGGLWFGFYGGGGGLVRFANDKFTAVRTDSDQSSSTLAMLVDKKGRLWIGSNEGGLTRIDDPTADTLTYTHITEQNGLSSDNIRCLAEDADGNVYAGTVRGVSRVDGNTDDVRNLTIADGLAGDFVQSIFRDRSGTMWFGTTNGISKYEPTAKRAPVPHEVFISSLQIAGNDYQISEFGQRLVDGIDVSSAENNVRIGFVSVGEGTRFQYKIEGTNEQDWTEPISQRTLNFANLSSGTYRLLVRAAGDATREPASVAFTIRPPFWRSWWFITLAALFVLGSVVALDRYRVSKTRQVQGALTQSRESETRFRTLADTASDAIITIDEDSTIVFVNQAVERVFGYTPEEIIGKPLTSLMPERMRDGHEAGLSRYILTSSRNIEWSGVTLPGLRKDGQEIPLELSFGEFERNGQRYFTGIARDISERLRAEEALRKAREERMRELQKVRSRIATDLHDDIGSSLTQIAVLSEVARGQASQLNADGVSTPLERIKNVSRELVAVMSDIVWAINPQKDYLNDLVQRMRRFGSDVLSGRGIGFEFTAPEMDGATELGANIRREVFAVFKESINNAGKYSECTKVATDFSVSGGVLTLTVSDDGKGFDTDLVLSEEFRPEMGGNGLASIRRRAAELGGVCDIRSEIGKGTKLVLKVPLHQGRNGNG